jgi:low affinity Fe/Cu permease
VHSNIRAERRIIYVMQHRIPYAGASFGRLASRVAHWMGHPAGFLLALGVVVAWVITGPIFRFSDTWQLVINTATTVVTFLMVFLIQNTQNRESRALQLKLDELIRALDGAHNALLDLEDLTDDELLAIRKQYVELARKARADLKRGRQDTAAENLADHRGRN